jgi:hypothetical protein
MPKEKVDSALTGCLVLISLVVLAVLGVWKVIDIIRYWI